MLSTIFLDSLNGLPGFDQQAFEAVHHQSKSITSIRLNNFKVFDTNAHPFLNDKDSVLWCENGYYLKERPSFVLDPLWHAGAYYVQEASSMFIQYLLKKITPHHTNLKVLDLCAAPGGKSTLLANYFHDGLIVSNEIIKNRNNILVENITKWGADNIVITQNDPSHFKAIPHFFDVMVIDAPCSGSGLFRKDPEAMTEWSLDSVAHCSTRQVRIIDDSIDSLKEGGYLMYSTCSYSFEEDEKIMDHIASIPGMVNVEIDVPVEWNIISCHSPVHHSKGFRFYPDKIKGEGFFITVFKKEVQSHANYGIDDFKLTSITKNDSAVLNSFFELPPNYQFISHQNMLIAIPALFEQAILTLLSHLYIKKLGVAVGEIKGKDFIPSHALAMSYWAKLPYEMLEVDRSTALNYLRRATVELEGNKGWNLITYAGIRLGWAKLLPNRSNNYYPNEWRILNY